MGRAFWQKTRRISKSGVKGPYSWIGASVRTRPTCPSYKTLAGGRATKSFAERHSHKSKLLRLQSTKTMDLGPWSFLSALPASTILQGPGIGRQSRATLLHIHTSRDGVQAEYFLLFIDHFKRSWIFRKADVSLLATATFNLEANGKNGLTVHFGDTL